MILDTLIMNFGVMKICVSINGHWRSSHYAIMNVRNKNSNIQGRSPNVAKVIFHTIRNCS